MPRGNAMDDQRKWQVSSTKDGRNVSWFPVVTFPREHELPPLSMGISSDLDWVLDGGVGAVFVINHSADLVGAFPLLEIDPGQVLGRLERHLAENQFEVSLVDKLPFSRIVAAALSAPTRHWPDDGLKWAAVLGPDREIPRALLLLSDSGTQRQRHTAARILRAQQSAQKGHVD